MNLRLLVITDIHASADPPAAAGESPLCGVELVRRAIEDAARRGGFDAIAVLGDLADRHLLPHAAAIAASIRAEIERAAPGVPVVVVPGNHDGDATALLAAVGDHAGLHEIGGCRLVSFADAYGPGEVCTRSGEDLRRLREVAAQGGGPLIVLQHNPVSPVIDDPYPYMHANRAEVMAAYRQAGVALSLSGHYHRGQGLNTVDGVRYCTVGALCEPPYSYAMVLLADGNVEVQPRRLAADEALRLVDSHAHTEFAYCGSGITAGGMIRRARQFGLGGICLVEHAPQLYCSAEEFWEALHIRRPATWRGGAYSRMAAFRQTMTGLRDDFVRVGLEVELDGEGQLTLHEEDRDWADILVGAVHWLGGGERVLDDAEFASEFMRTSEGLMQNGVDVLAHPWRAFKWAKHPVPTDLYGPLADLLGEFSVAAEINFHHNEPEEDFFALCVEKGVRLALASDAHAMYEAGLMGAHVDLLRQIAPGRDLRDVLAF